MITAFLSTSAHWFVSAALAVVDPSPPCPAGLDCSGGATNVLGSLAQAMAAFALRLATGLSLVMVLYGGLLMVISQGDEGQIGKGKNYVIYSLAGLALATMSQNIYSFVYDVVNNVNPNDAVFGGILPGLANAIVVVFNPLFIIAIAVAGCRMVLDRGKDQEFGKAKTALIWACAGAVIVNIGFALTKGVLGIFAGANGL